MKYAFLTTGSLKQNSSFIRLRELGLCLSQVGLDVFYFMDSDPYNYSLRDKINFAQLIFIERVRNNTVSLSQLFERRSKIYTLKPNILHFLNPSFNNVFSMLGLSKNICILSDYDELFSQRVTHLGYKYAYYCLESLAKLQSDITIVASLHLQKHFQDKFNFPSLYLPYATYLENIEVGPNPFERPTAVYMGNLHHDGDHDILIDAWTILESQGEAPELSIIGGGPCLESVKSDVEQRGLTQIKFLGYLPVQQNQNYLHHAHFLLFPIRDTIGNRMRCPSKTFAYMQAGRPIVTCRVGEVAEAIGDQGIYVEPTAEAFAQKVRDLFYQSLDNISYNLERHTWESRAKELMEAIETLGVKN